ncbi:expansin-A9-like [Diospyros lotus]|uniref:expansin-A9-like n=1 Tax=Diospyros lotus TaxID=55363 RepID=UPI002258CA24|nr:expansin-A9-like [Diospyros lotus]
MESLPDLIKSLLISTLLLLLLLPVLVMPHDHAENNVNPMWKGHRSSALVHEHHKPHFAPGPWKEAHATFYGGSDGSETTEGACGYEVVKHGYGLETAALSQVLFKEGETCGACYEIKCVNSEQWCKPGQPSLIVTATNVCPPNFNLPSDNGGWCNPPREHFDLPQPAFLKIAEHKGGIVPIHYRRVSCNKQGGIKFTVEGNPYFVTVMVTNVGGAGDVTHLQVKGDEGQWTDMKRDWGQKWQTNASLVGQTLSFRVQTSDGMTSTSWNIAPKNWQFGQTFEGKNFH